MFFSIIRAGKPNKPIGQIAALSTGTELWQEPYCAVQILKIKRCGKNRAHYHLANEYCELAQLFLACGLLL
jgi:hypothetical protein